MINKVKREKLEEEQRLLNHYSLSRLYSIQEIRSDLYNDTYFNPTVLSYFQDGQTSMESATSQPAEYREMLESSAKEYSKYQEEYRNLVQSFASSLTPPDEYSFSLMFIFL